MSGAQPSKQELPAIGLGVSVSSADGELQPRVLHRWGLIVALALLSSVAPFSTDMYLAAFPTMVNRLHATASEVQLTLTSFLIGVALGQLLLGPISDRFGRRRPLLICVTVATIASGLCAVTSGIWSLIGLRFIHGLAGAGGLVIARAVIFDRFEGVAAARAMSMMVSIGPIAPMIAPLAGGAILQTWGWRSEFWVLTLISLVMALASFFLVPESLPPAQRAQHGGFGPMGTAHSLMRDRDFVMFMLCAAFAFGASMAYISASPFVVQRVLGLSTTVYTFVYAAGALSSLGAASLNTRLLRARSAYSILCVGISVRLGMAVMLLGAIIGRAPALVILALMLGTPAGGGFTLANPTSLALERGRSSLGMASALSGALPFALGAAISPLVGLAGSHTALPMGLVILVCSFVSGAVLIGVRPDKR